MPDNFETFSNNLEAPARSGMAITTSDTATFNASRGLYVGGAGNAVVKFAGDSSTVTLTGLLAGVVYPFRLIQVLATNTTATALVRLE